MIEPDEKIVFLNPRSIWFRVVLMGMFFFAFLLRLDDLHAPGHLIDREYTSAIFARYFYFQNNPGIEAWRQENMQATMQRQPVLFLEPPVTEWLVSWLYRLAGREDLVYSRFLTNAFWIIGGSLFYKTVRRLLAPGAAIIVTAYTLFAPWSILISRSFQPDALMMLLFLASLYWIVRYFQKPAWQSLIAAGLLTGLTLLVRPLVLFGLYGAFFALLIVHYRKTPRNALVPLLVYCGLGLVPALVFYGYAIFIAQYMNWKIAHSFRPHMLAQWEFWRGWLDQIVKVAGPVPLLAALVGFFLHPRKPVQILIAGFAAGYLIFGMFFTYHTYTHPYYHIQLLPVIGLCLAPVAVRVARLFKEMPVFSRRASIAAILLVGLYLIRQEVITNLYMMPMEDPAMDQEIGQAVHHSPRTVFVARYYGFPLQYYAELTGAAWPVSIDDPFFRDPDAQALSVQERIDLLGFTPEYFVITDLEFFRRQHPDLRAYLTENCSLTAQKDGYLVYSACHPVTQKTK